MNSDKLLELLELAYPDRLPMSELSAYEMGILRGNREVVEWFKYIASTGNISEVTK